MKGFLVSVIMLGFLTTANAAIYKMTNFTKLEDKKITQQVESGSGDLVPFSTDKGVLWIHIDSPAMDVLNKSKVGECYDVSGDAPFFTAKKENCFTINKTAKMTQKQIDNCVNKWINAYRKEMGVDSLVRQDMLDEWESWCKAGKKL